MIETTLISSALPTPSAKQIIEYARANNIQLYWFCGIANSRVLAAVPLCIERRRVHLVQLELARTIGPETFDYPLFYCEPSSVRSLLEASTEFARVRRLDAVFFEHITGPRLILSRLEGIEYELAYFESRKCGEGWGWLTHRKSLRQKRRTAARRGHYVAQTVYGADILPHLDAFVRLHAERWRFDDVHSPLTLDWRRENLVAMSDYAAFTFIELSGVLVAAHYGLIQNGTLIWHLVAINVRFLDISPLQLLLLETAEACSKHGITCLDYGQGREDYKNRFANFTRACSDVLLPTSIRGTAARSIGRLAAARPQAKGEIEQLGHSVQSFLRTLRSRLDGVRYFVNEGSLCAEDIGVDRPISALATVTDHTFRLIGDYREFCATLDRSGQTIKRCHYERFRKGDACCCIMEYGREVVAHGWCRTGSDFRLSGNGDILNLEGAHLLYGFSAEAGDQSQELYECMLRNLVWHLKGKPILTFEARSEKTSIRGIEALGFRSIGRKELLERGMIRKNHFLKEMRLAAFP